MRDIWKAHADSLRNIRLHKARKRDKYAKELPKYSVRTKVLVRNFTRKPLERKFLEGYKVVKVLSNNSYELSKPNGRTFKVNIHHIRPYGKVNTKSVCNHQSIIHQIVFLEIGKCYKHHKD